MRTRTANWQRAALTTLAALLLVAGLWLLLAGLPAQAQRPAGVTAALTVTKAVNTTQAAPGDTLAYTVTVQNTSTSAVDAWMTDTLPVELTYVPGSLHALIGQTGFANGVITWSYSVPPLGSDIIYFQAQITSTLEYANIVNTAVVTGGGERVQDSATTLAVAAVGNLDNASTYKTVAETSVEPGDLLHYTIRVTNDSTDPVPNARFTDTLPGGLEFVTGSLTSLVGQVGYADGVITWSHSLSELSYDEVHFQARVPFDVRGGWLTNTVEIAGPIQHISRSAAVSVVVRPPDLSLVKSVSAAQADPGDTLTYTIRVSNSGEGSARTILVTDSLPSRLDYLSHSASVGMAWVSDGLITWHPTWGATGTLVLPPQGDAVLTITARVDPTISRTVRLVNTAYLTGTGQLLQDQAATNVSIISYAYLPLVLKRWPPIPYDPVLNTINNPDRRDYYTVSWLYDHNDAPATSFTLQEATDANFTNPTEYTTGSTSYLFTDKANGTYYYRVRGNNSYGSSGWSNVESTVVRWPPVPYAPTLNAINNPDNQDSYTVSWVYNYTDILATSYVLQEATDANFTNPTEYVTSDTSYSFSGKSRGTYYYRVKGRNSYGDGEWSNVQSTYVVGFSYFEDFSDIHSGWPSEVSKTRWAFYEVDPNPPLPDDGSLYPTDGNAYFIARRSGSEPRARFSPGVAIPSANYEMELDTRWWDGNFYATYQIFFGASSDLTDYYAVQVRINTAVSGPPICEYSLARHGGGSTVLLKDWTYLGSLHCERRRTDSSAQWNHWKIRRENNDIILYLNGSYLGTWHDTWYGANRYFGVGATLYEGFTPSKPEFDNWSITVLD